MVKRFAVTLAATVILAGISLGALHARITGMKVWSAKTVRVARQAAQTSSNSVGSDNIVMSLTEPAANRQRLPPTHC
jgi:hypothetical protein